MNDGLLRPALSCVLPARNEEGCIRDTVLELRAVLDRAGIDAEILVVDDGSTDRTAQIVLDLSTHDPRTILVQSQAGDHGYGAAIREGFRRARADVLFWMDSDGQFDPTDLPALFEAAATTPVVVGYRAGRADPTLRLGLSWCFNRLARTLLGTQARDANCAFKLFHRRAWEQFSLKRNDYLINVELLAQSAARGFAVREFPVRHRPRRTGRSKVGIGDVPRSFGGLLSLWRKGG